MIRIKKAVERVIARLFTYKNVDFSRLRFSYQSSYIREGWGGKDITLWPVYAFYKDYVNGERKIAHTAHCNWYLDQLKKYHGTSKEEGGMHWGSVYRSIVKKYTEKKIDYGNDIFFDPAVVALAIRERVDDRFALLESIRQNGYDPKVATPIEGIKRKGYIYVMNGHHRWAIFKLLGYDCVPEIRAFSESIYTINITIKRILGRWKTSAGMK